jgi:trans-aconitate 2-methyltransferase
MVEWNAAEYNRQASLQAALAEEQLARLTFEGSERVLDVGCGDGRITAEVAARVPNGSVLGVDPSRDMVDFATTHFAALARPNLRFEVADARSLPYQSEFDRVLSFNALHWVPEQNKALRAIRTAVKDGRHALLRLVPQGPRRSLEDVLEDARLSSRWATFYAGFRTPFAHFTPAEYRELAGQNGFRVVRLNVEDRAWDFRTRESFAAFGRATFVEWLRPLQESDWPAFIADVLDRYQGVAAEGPNDAHTFKFYQMEVVLEAT